MARDTNSWQAAWPRSRRNKDGSQGNYVAIAPKDAAFDFGPADHLRAYVGDRVGDPAHASLRNHAANARQHRRFNSGFRKRPAPTRAAIGAQRGDAGVAPHAESADDHRARTHHSGCIGSILETRRQRPLSSCRLGRASIGHAREASRLR